MIKGIWKDIYYDSKDNIIGIEKGSNIWVESAMRFYMGTATGQIDPATIYYACGEGLSSWDTTTPMPKPKVYQTTLTTEVLRKPVDSMTYMKIGSGTAQSGTLTEIYDPWRENPLTSLYWGRFEPDSFFNGSEITITAGTNAGEVRNVVSYEQISGKITVDIAFPEACDDTTQYEFTPAASLGESNAIEFRTTLDYTDLTSGVYLREQGLFGGTAAISVNSGYMLDCIHHAKIWKDGSVKIVRFITLSFNP